MSLYVDISSLLPAGMKTPTKTPVEILREELERAGIEKTELGRKLGSKSPYIYVREILTGRKAFDAELQAKVADALGKPRNFFSDPQEASVREAHIAETFAKFCRGDIGSKLDDEIRRSLKAFPFLGRKLPTVSLYEAMALAMQGHMTALSAHELNAELDEMPEPDPPSPPTRRRK